MKWIPIICVIGIGILLFIIGRCVEGKKSPPPPSGSQQQSPLVPPTPTPASVASETNWVWPVIIGILAIVVVIWVIAPMLTKTTTAPAPKVAAPKKELRKQVVKIPLEFVGGENLVREPGRVEIRKGGHANFRFSLPNVINGKYKIHYHGQRNKEGLDFLEINRGKGNGAPFSIEHGATDFPIELIFFDSGYATGMPGEAKYFRSGENYFKLWANDSLIVQLDKPPYVEITYWE